MPILQQGDITGVATRHAYCLKFLCTLPEFVLRLRSYDN